MATVGSISIGFEAEIDGLRAGMDAVVASLQSVGEAAEALGKQLSGLTSTQFSISVDTSSLGEATKSVEDLTTEVETSKKGFEEAGKGAEVLSEAVEATGKAAEEASGKVAGIANDVTEALTASKKEALAGTEAYVGMRDSLAGLAGTATGALSAVASASNTAGAAAAGLSNAIDAVASGKGLGGVADASIVAAGRIEDAYNSIRDLFGNVLPAAFVAAQVSVARFAGGFGGLSVVTAALGGSTAAAAIAIGTFGAAAASAGAAIATYAGLMAIARIATAGLSEEAQLYAQRTAAVVAAMAAGTVAARAGADAYRLIAGGIFASRDASTTLTAAFRALSDSVQRAVAPARALVSVLTVASVSFNLASAAATKSGAGFAAVAARAAATSAAIGATTGAVSAYVAGTGVLAGATAGATAAVSGLVTAFPVYAGVAVLAAVATGRVSKELETLGGKFGQINDLADRFGKPTQEIEKLQIAARNAGVAFNAVARGQQTFASNLEKVKVGNLGSQQAREAAAAFNDLGLSADKLNKLSPEEAMREVAAALTGVESATKRTQIAMDIFGKTGPALLPLLKKLKEVEADMGRLGGTTSTIDVKRFDAMSDSFNRVQQASASLSQNLLLPFTRMQEAVNNATAEIQGGLSPVFNALGGIIVQATTPLAVMIEMLGRVLGIAGRMAGVVAKLVTVFLPLGTIASIADGIRQGFMDAMKPIEQLVSFLESVADRITAYLGGTSAVFTAIGEAIGFVVGGLVQLATYVAIGAGVWALYSAAVAVATGFSISATASFVAMWLAALGPVALVIGALAAVGLAVALLTAGVVSLFNWFTGWGEAKEQIDGATASVDELASAVAETESASSGIEGAMLAVGEAAAGAADEVGAALGFSEEQIEQFKNSVGSAASAVASLIGISLSGGEPESDRFEKARESIEGARDAMADYSIRAAQLGTAGADAIAKSSEEFNALQRELASGKVTLEQFNEKNAEIQSRIKKDLDEIAKGSPEQTLQKNLEVFKQMDESAKQVAKSVRDIGAGVQIGDKFFPRSDEVKSRAQQYATEYNAALEAIKKKLATGGFQQEIDAQRAELERARGAGEIDEATFKAKNAELDKTSAQEQASIAAEEVQRELDRKQASLKIELDFADNIRKNLETAFLSPVELFQRELDKIRTNVDLTDEEKALAEQDLRKSAREQLVGKSAAETLQDRRRDISQGVASGLISRGQGEAAIRSAEASRREAAGLESSPAQQLQLGVDRINDAFGVAGQSIEEIQANLSPAEFAEYQKAVEDNAKSIRSSLGVEESVGARLQESRERLDQAVRDGIISQEEANDALKSQRDDILSSLGIDKSPIEAFEEAAERLADAAGEGAISQEELAKGAAKARDALLNSLGIPLNPVEELARRTAELDKAKAKGLITQEQYNRGLEEAKKALPGGEAESPLAQFQRDMKAIDEAAANKLIGEDEAEQRRQNIRAELQENLKPAIDSVAPDRRLAAGADTRSKAGVDTFFRILQGRDNPSLKAQQEIARNTRILADAQNEPEAQAVIAQLSAR